VLTRIFVLHRARLFYQVNLKPNKIPYILTIISNGDHSQKIHERLASPPVIYKTDLGFPLFQDHSFQIANRFVIDIFSLYPGFDFSVWRLKEAAVPTENHVFIVSGQTLKNLGAIDDWLVIHCCVTDNKRARQIHGSDVDFCIWAVGYA